MTANRAAHYSRIIMAPYFNTGRGGSPPAGIIWTISKSGYDKTDSLVYLNDIVDFEFYIEGFNSHPTTNSKNISIRFYVEDILEESLVRLSNAENWNWKVNYKFDEFTRHYSLERKD